MTRFNFSFDLRVRWGECDAQGIAFNAQYLNFIEVAQAEYFRAVGVPLYDETSRASFDLATVKATMEFLAPARVDDILRIYIRITRIGNASVAMDAEIRRPNNPNAPNSPDAPNNPDAPNTPDAESLLHRAQIVYANYDAATATSRPVPDDIRRLIAAHEGAPLT